MNDEIAMHAVKPQLLPLGISGVDEFLAMFTPSGDTENSISVDEPSIHSSQSLHPC